MTDQNKVATEDKVATRNKVSRTFALTLLRVGAGVIMVTHGWMKLADLPATQGSFATMGIPEPQLAAYLAVAGELFGGLGLLVGLLTPIAGLGVLCTMIVAIAYVHFPNGLLAQNGGFEYPLTLGLVALYFVTRGAGPVSLDAWLARRRAATAARESARRHHIPGQRPHHVGA